MNRVKIMNKYKREILKLTAVLMTTVLATSCGQKNSEEAQNSNNTAITDEVSPTKEATVKPTDSATDILEPEEEEAPRIIDLSNYTLAEGYDDLYEVASFDGDVFYSSAMQLGDKLLIIGTQPLNDIDESEYDGNSEGYYSDEAYSEGYYSDEAYSEGYYSDGTYSKDDNSEEEASGDEYYDDYGDYEEAICYGFVFSIYDPIKKEIEATINGDDYGCTTYLTAGENLIIVDENDNILYIFDDDLENATKYDLPEGNSEGWYSYYAGEDALPLYRYNYATGELSRIILDAFGKLREITLDIPYYSISISAVMDDGDTIVLSGVNANTLKYEVAEWNTKENQAVIVSSDIPCNGYIYSGNSDGLVIFEVENTDEAGSLWACQKIGGEADYFTFEYDYPELTADGKLFFNIYAEGDEADTNLLYLYDTDGTAIANLKFKSASYDENGITEEYMYLTNSAIPTENPDYYYIVVSSELKGLTIYLWDTSKDSEELSNITHISYEEREQELTNEASAEKLDELIEYYDEAEQFGEKYGVSLYIANQVPSSIDTYNLEQELEPEKIEDAITTLDEIFSEYPDNFFGQLAYGAIDEINIYLCGTITSNSAGNLDEADAFVNNTGSVISMVLNVNSTYYWPYNVNHELSHIIDARLSFEGLYNDGIFSELEWSTLNPEDFDYSYDYSSFYDADFVNTFVMKYMDAFIGEYGMTYPTEDRAMIFGIACQIDTDDTDFYPTWNDIVNGSYIQAKYEYYCKSIRAGFDTTGWPETTFWETGLTYIADAEG
jgi:hypothetical protein